jgi:hypothetical protein
MQPGHSSLYVYSRDNLAHPLRLMEEMLAAVVAGSFRPDATRSGRFIRRQEPPPDRDEEMIDQAGTDSEFEAVEPVGEEVPLVDQFENTGEQAEEVELSDSSDSDHSASQRVS